MRQAVNLLFAPATFCFAAAALACYVTIGTVVLIRLIDQNI